MVLRQPHGQARGSELDATEAASDHLLALSAKGRVIGCGRIHPREPGVGQIRSMAVAPEYRGRGLGAALLNRLERLGRGRGYDRLFVEARDSARGLYRAAEYQDLGPGRCLFGEIPHTRMSKPVDHRDFDFVQARLRPAQTGDGPAVRELIFNVLREFNLGLEPNGIDRDMDDFPHFYDPGLFAVLEDATQLLGCVALHRVSPEVCELRRMYLHPVRRGAGVGRALLGYALSQARRRGYRCMELETATILTQALTLYRWAGFADSPQARHARRCDRKMFLALARPG